MSANSHCSPTPFSPTSLTPGFMVVHANRLEDLRGLAVQWMRLHPLGPLENETILVQSNGIGQWLKLALAEDRKTAERASPPRWMSCCLHGFYGRPTARCSPT